MANTNVPYRTGQQAGRAVDYLQGWIKNGGIVPPTLLKVSDTTGGTWATIYQTNLNTDWTKLNALAPCKVGSVNGLFSTRQDSAGVYICNGTNGTGTALIAAYASLADNKARLKAAWPAIYNTDAGIFADQISKRYGMGTDTVSAPKSGDIYFAANFACSQWFAGSVTNRGYLPKAGTAGDTDQMPVGCTLPTMTTKCKKLFTGPGQFPSGNVFNCNGTSGVASETQKKLLRLGTNGLPAYYTATRNKLDLERSDVHFFANDAAYQAAFTAAGQPFGTITGKCGATAPVGAASVRRWQSIMNEGCTLANTPGKQAYVTSHELGHVIDLTDSQPSALTDFDVAMQFDWVKLNWIDYPSQTKRQPCSNVVFGGTTYPGVLIGLTDTNGATFCVGSALRTGKPYSAATSISEVLQLDNPANPGEMHRDPLGGPIGSPPFTVNPGWYEWYAQSIAIRARTDLALGISSSNRPVYDELVLDGYFECTAGPSGWVQLNYLNPSSGSKLNTAAACVGKVLPDGWFFIH